MSPDGIEESNNSTNPDEQCVHRGALNVISTKETPSYSPDDTPELNLKKIIKKRRKENDEVAIEHSKSNREYLRKAQESLIPLDDPSGGLQNHFSSSSSSSNNNGPESNPYGYEEANPYGYEDPDQAARSRFPSGTTNGGFCNETKETSSNPYGYEDPDAAPTVRRVGSARRRGSVTKFSLQAAAAAKVATERILNMKLTQQERFCSSPSNGCTASGSCEVNILRQQRLRRSDGLLSSPRGGFNRMALNNRYQRKSYPTFTNEKSLEKACRSDFQPTTPIRQRSGEFTPSVGNQMSLPSQSIDSQVPSLEDYGYENPDMKDSSSSSLDSSSSSLLSKGRPLGGQRSVRRGHAATKYSVTQTKVAQSDPMDNDDSEHSLELNDIRPMIVQDQASGHKAPNRTPSNHSHKRSVLTPKGSGSLHSLSRAALSIRKESFQSLQDSLGSIGSLSIVDDPRSARPPSRTPSWRKPVSRNDSTKSFGSDADSLASDMISLCSISKHDERSIPVTVPTPTGFQKSIVNRTPSMMSSRQA